jgi:hypothetical protein
MTPDTPTLARSVRRWVIAAGVAGLFALVGCKSNKESKGTNVARGKDPLVYGPNLIPKQNVPVPDRATGPKTGVDPLTTPTGGGGKAGYNDDPARFQGTYIPGKSSTPAALAGRLKDGDELKIADTGGVTLTPAGGTLPAGALEPPEDTLPLLAQLEKYGVAPGDRSFERDGAKYTFRASVPIRNSNGARRQYTGTGKTARDAVKQVLDQLASEK